MSRITGRQIINALKGRWHGAYGTCRCPAHPDKSPSLSVREVRDQILVKCFAGCDNRDIIAALRSQGLWPARDESGFTYRKSKSLHLRHDANPDKDGLEIAKEQAARAIWERALPIQNTPAALYLWSRGLDISHLPPTLRCAPELYHREAKKSFPALIGAIQSGVGKVTAVQRIWVSPKLVVIDGKSPPKGTKAPVTPAKKTLGPMLDGAIRLAKPGRTLGISEGIETALSARERYHLPVWASCGAWRMRNILLPEIVERLVLFADAGSEGLKAAERAAEAFMEQGYEVDIQPPPPGFEDFNDISMARAAGRVA